MSIVKITPYFILGKHATNDNEYSGISDPIIRTNFNIIYSPIYHNDLDTFVALDFLQIFIHELSNIDYELYCGRNKPDAMMFMTYQTENNFIRCDDIMFLDSHKYL